MVNRYNCHQNLHLNHTKRSIFLPMLCSKVSINKDVMKLPKDKPSDDDLLSPKIDCMGQVKRNTRIIGFPALDITAKINNSCNANNTTNDNGIKYFKLKKLFSGKRKQGSVEHGGKESSGSSSINIENTDPPLPVIKRVPKQGDKGEGDTLWQRRSRGVSLESLQLQQIRLNRRREPTTV